MRRSGAGRSSGGGPSSICLAERACSEPRRAQEARPRPVDEAKEVQVRAELRRASSSRALREKEQS